jgi:hypothetical protein
MPPQSAKPLTPSDPEPASNAGLSGMPQPPEIAPAATPAATSEPAPASASEPELATPPDETAFPLVPTEPPLPDDDMLPLSESPMGTSPRPKRYWPVAAAVIAAIILTIGGYWLGARAHTDSDDEQTESVHTTTTVALPKDATITAECVDMRGKQYIIPKDIPMGPIYDVYQGKVIAIEYLVGQTELIKQTDMFADLPLPTASYDHLTLMPMDPHAGENEQHFHAIAYLISANQAAKIKCAASSDMNMPTM